jgi:hypothetical protein
MTIQRGKDLASQSNPDPNELKNAIIALENEKKYVENCILIGFRDSTEGQTVVDEISSLIHQLKEKQ